jgi:hypothetical protein
MLSNFAFAGVGVRGSVVGRLAGAAVVVLSVGALWAAILLMPPSAAAAGCLIGQQAQTFSYTGSEQCYAVPAGVMEVSVVAVGAPGGNGGTWHGGRGLVPGAGVGADGAQLSGDLAVTPGEVLYVEVGGTGEQRSSGSSFNYGSSAFNGGGPGGFDTAMGGGDSGGGGGGASDVRTVSCAAGCPGDPASLASRLLVAVHP